MEQMHQKNPQNETDKAQQTVVAFIHALNDEDFDLARHYVTEDLLFVGVLGTREGADAYFSDMKEMKLKYTIRKVFADTNEVCLLYDIMISGVTIFACGWYRLTNDKISSFDVIFDPRSLLQDS